MLEQALSTQVVSWEVSVSGDGIISSHYILGTYSDADFLLQVYS